MGNPYKTESEARSDLLDDGFTEQQVGIAAIIYGEGHAAGKAEQAEIVTELVTALSFYLVDWSIDGTIHQATIDFATAAQEKARKAIAKGE